jgi:hypothetical protein
VKLVGTLGMLPLYHLEKGDDVSQMCDDIEKTSYILAHDGLWLLKKTDFFWSLRAAKVPNAVEKTEALINTHGLPLVPKEEMDTAIAFFRRVYAIHKSEAALILYWLPGTTQFKWTCPKQTVAPASVNYSDVPHPGEGWIVLLHMHSHASMSAFHSGTDDHDEKFVDGYNITIGKLNTPGYEFECRIMIGGLSLKSKMEDIVENWLPPVGEFPNEWLNNVNTPPPYVAPAYTPYNPPVGCFPPVSRPWDDKYMAPQGHGSHNYVPPGQHGEWKSDLGKSRVPLTSTMKQQNNVDGKRSHGNAKKNKKYQAPMSDLYPLSGPSRNTSETVAVRKWIDANFKFLTELGYTGQDYAAFLSMTLAQAKEELEADNRDYFIGNGLALPTQCDILGYKQNVIPFNQHASGRVMLTPVEQESDGFVPAPFNSKTDTTPEEETTIISRETEPGKVDENPLQGIYLTKANGGII